ncbi:MAG TPA: hypothetical protein VM557_11100 [Thermoanaerobaculia bacterium]|nr:hypothetical protein [Thermoanaerobaculia bacterium]
MRLLNLLRRRETVPSIRDYGSAERKVKGVTSQTIQLDEAGAGELVMLLLETFPRLRS